MHRPAAFIFVLSLAEAAASQVVINEIGIAPTGGAGSQFIELFNRGGCTVDLSCYTLVFSSTSGGGNPTGWTIKIPSGKTIAGGGYFLLGGTAGTAGVSGGTGYPTGGAVNSYAGAADVNIGSALITANAVYMKQGLAAGNFSNTKGQLSLLDAAGNLITSVSYNSGNNAGTYPLSAYTACNASGNIQGSNNIVNPGASANNVNAVFSAATNEGIYLASNGNYSVETSLTPGASNKGNGGTQICSGPVLNSVSNASVCFATTAQLATLTYSAFNSPTNYSLTWNGIASTYFNTANNATLAGSIPIPVTANVPPGIYSGALTLNNACGSSCAKLFTVTVNALPTVNAGSYAPVCVNGSPVALNGTPIGGTFSGTNVVGNNFVSPNAGSYTINYTYTDATTGCTNTASTIINVSAPLSTFTTACTSNPSFVFFGQTLTTTGLHTVLLNGNPCTDTAKVYLVIKQTVSLDTAACDSVMINGTAYYNDTILRETISSVVTACDSLEKDIHVRIKKPSEKDTMACVGLNGSFALLGQTFTQSGNYVLHATNLAGCDSSIHLRLTVANAQPQLHSGCDSVVVNGQRFYTSTTFTDTLRNGLGCDSLLRTHNVVVNHSSHNYVSVCLAAGQTYNFNGRILNASGDYTTILNGISCDSFVHLHLLIAQPQTITYQGCTNYTYNGVKYTASTTLLDTLRSAATGCDSVLRTVQIIISPVLNTYITACIPQGQTYLFNNQSLGTSGFYTAQLTTHDGCDSVVHLYLTVAAVQTLSVSGCDSLLWKGKIYYLSTQVIDTVRSLVSACDSLYEVTNIIITSSPVQRISVCLGIGQTYTFNGQVLSTSGHYVAIFNRNGLCDSTVYLNLVIPVVQQQTISGCRSVVYKGKTYTTSTFLKDTLRSQSFCDSLYQNIQITIMPTIQTFSTVCISQGQSYNFNGQVLTTGGHYSTTYPTEGCDSIVQLYLVVGQNKTQSVQGCDSVLFNGQIYHASTFVRDTIRSFVSGCDSLITVTTISVHNTKHQYLSACLQPGETYNFNGRMLSTTGFYQATFATTACDSIVHLYLVVAGRQTITINGCNKVVYNGIHYTLSAVVTDTVKSLVTSCDSLYREVQISVAAVPPTFITHCVSADSGYFFNGQMLTTTGDYAARFVTATGCDSLVLLHLLVSKLNAQAIKGCDSIVYKGRTYTASILIADTIKSLITQCDSIINSTAITINKKPLLTLSHDTTICRWGMAILSATSSGATVNWTGFGNTNSIVVSPQNTTQYLAVAVDTAGCSSTKVVTVYVQDFSMVLRADKNPALSGTNVAVQSSGNYFYSVTGWQPTNLFSNQTAQSQRLMIDTSVAIAVVGQSMLGCKDTAILQLIAIPLDDVYVPSAFTPNNDGRNDEVKVMGTAIVELSFTIFNRWGQVIFHTTDKSRGWDGTRNGVLQPAGTYVYVARIKKGNGQVVEKKGTITLVK